MSTVGRFLSTDIETLYLSFKMNPVNTKLYNLPEDATWLSEYLFTLIANK